LLSCLFLLTLRVLFQVFPCYSLLADSDRLDRFSSGYFVTVLIPLGLLVWALVQKAEAIQKLLLIY
jgi:hypothetical protein